MRPVHQPGRQAVRAALPLNISPLRDTSLGGFNMRRLMRAAAVATIVVSGCTGAAAPSGSAPASHSAPGGTVAPTAPASSSLATTPSAGPTSAPTPTPTVAPTVSIAPTTQVAATSRPSASAGASVVLKLEALNIAFTQIELRAPAGRIFRVSFTNQDPSTPHGFEIVNSSGQTLFSGDLVTGPGHITYVVPALPAGNYTFSCPVHPNMAGTLTVTK